MRPGRSAFLLTGLLITGIGQFQPAVPAQDQSPKPNSGSARPANPPIPDQARTEEETTFGMSPAVACLRVDGFERYTTLPDATLTSADKLKVYFRPLRFKYETDFKNRSPYRASFVEDGKIRRKGEKTVLTKEDKLLEYETRFAAPDYQIYLVNTIGLEKLSPGEYELDITLHDMIDGKAIARQSLPFRVVASAVDPVKVEAPASKPDPAPARSKKSSKGSGRTTKAPGLRGG